MPLFIDFPPEEESPPLPDDRLHGANLLAEQEADAGESRTARERHLRRELRHPLHQKVLDAVSSYKVLIYGFLAVVFLVDIYLEWGVSNEIYAVVFPLIPWLLTAFCVTVAVYSSLCLGETTSNFSFLSLNSEAEIDADAAALQETVNSQYDRANKRKTETGWYFHPLAGAIAALALLVLVYYASHARVEYLIGAGELEEGFATNYHLYLPVLLYAFEIMLGMPAAFFIVCMRHVSHVRKLTKELTKNRDDELTLQYAAIREYAYYPVVLSEYNRWAREHNKPERPLNPPSPKLRRLLDEIGYDRIREACRPGSDHEAHRHGANGMPASNAQASTGEGADAGTSPAQSQGARIQDLLNFMDDRIDQTNRDL